MAEEYTAIYGRISDEDKKGDVSVPMQLDRCREYISYHKEEFPYLIKEYSEQKSAKDLNREEVKRLISDIKKDVIKIVLIYRLDRIVRREKDMCYLLDLFDRHKVRFVSVTQNFDQNTPDGRFTIHLYAALAELELNTDSKRTDDVLKEKFKKGITLSKPPYGYIGIKDEVDGKIKIIRWDFHPEESKAVKRMFELFDKGCNLSQLSREHNLSRQTVKNILSNPTYLGKRRFQGEVADGDPNFHKAIISQDLFDRVQMRLNSLKIGGK